MLSRHRDSFAELDVEDAVSCDTRDSFFGSIVRVLAQSSDLFRSFVSPAHQAILAERSTLAVVHLEDLIDPHHGHLLGIQGIQGVQGTRCIDPRRRVQTLKTPRKLLNLRGVLVFVGLLVVN